MPVAWIPVLPTFLFPRKFVVKGKEETVLLGAHGSRFRSPCEGVVKKKEKRILEGERTATRQV